MVFPCDPATAMKILRSTRPLVCSKATLPALVEEMQFLPQLLPLAKKTIHHEVASGEGGARFEEVAAVGSAAARSCCLRGYPAFNFEPQGRVLCGGVFTSHDGRVLAFLLAMKRATNRWCRSWARCRR